MGPRLTEVTQQRQHPSPMREGSLDPGTRLARLPRRVLSLLLLCNFLLSPMHAAVVPGGSQEEAVESLEDVFDRVHRSVVTIRTVERELDLASGSQGRTGKVGSGVLVSAEGSVLTAAHVVQLADEVVVEFSDGSRWPADVVAAEPVPDLALLKLRRLPPEGVPVAALGDSDRMRIGNRIFIVGAPQDLSHTLTVGHVSARRKEEWFLGGMRHVEHFQTDASINSGNSGGPMFNLKGEVVGTVCHMISQSGGSEGLGFAVTSNAARELILDRKSFWSGFTASLLHESLAHALNVPDGRTGMLVQRVAQGSPAESLGLRAGTIVISLLGAPLVLGGDVILELQGVPIESQSSRPVIADALRSMEPGDQFRAVVLRGGRVIELSTTL